MQLRRFALVTSLMLAVLSVGSAADPKPMEKAKAGEWVLEKVVAGGYTTFTYMWIAKVDGRKVTVDVQILKDDGKLALMPPQPSTIDLDKPDPKKVDDSKVKTSEDDVEIKGKKYKCTKTESEQDIQGSGRLTIVNWSSPEIPIYGTARSIAKDKEGKVVSETTCVEFGHEGGAEKPQK